MPSLPDLRLTSPVSFTSCTRSISRHPAARAKPWRGCRQALVDRPAGRSAERRLARQARQHRHVQIGELVQTRAGAPGCAPPSCRSRSPGRPRCARAPMPASLAVRTASRRKFFDLAPPRHRSAARCCMVAGVAFHVHEAHGAAGLPRPPRARRARQRLDVVDHRGAGGERRLHHRRAARVDRDAVGRSVFSSTGSTRRSSSCGDRRGAGRRRFAADVEMSAPSAASRRACATAACGSRKRPPSENESGVTFTTPMTRGLSSEQRELPAPQLHAVGAARFRPARHRRLSAQAAGRWQRRVLSAPPSLAGGLAARAEGFGGRGGLPAMMSSIWSASMRLPLEQRLGHRLDLVAVVLQQLARERVLLVDDAADLGVDLLHRRFGHVLVRGDRAAEEHLALVLAVDHRCRARRTCPTA